MSNVRSLQGGVPGVPPQRRGDEDTVELPPLPPPPQGVRRPWPRWLLPALGVLAAAGALAAVALLVAQGNPG
ncbi:MAG: hypothetical protein AUI14_10580 [Actinobacteria bacterium 13_2_20CM_2_71_6]|nr:MAG: hypothetical protein AUI14_10580 [Actinobacteria bacterium 13_2_20CM_2_71_6]